MSKIIQTLRAFQPTSPRVPAILAAFALFIFMTLAAPSTSALTYTVTNTADSGAGSLRQAVTDANGTAANDVIVFNIPTTDANCAAATGVCTITLTTGEIIVQSAGGTLSIQGTGANRLTISGNNASRIFYSNGATFTLSGATLTNGNGAGASSSGDGGAIYANGGTTVLRAVYVAANMGGGYSNIGGGAYFSGGSNHQIVNSTFSANGNVVSCGGLINDGGTMSIVGATFTGNAALGVGGGICNIVGTMTMRAATVFNDTGMGVIYTNGTLDIGNSIVTSSINGYSIDHAGGTVTSAGYNLISSNISVNTSFPAGNPNANNDIVGTTAAPINAQLAPLGNYGGTVPTRALCTASGVPNVSCTAASPAIDKGSAVAGVSTDGRGVIRPYDIFTTANASGGSGADIGAFELVPTGAFGWGFNSFGEVGDGTTTNPRTLPTQMAGGFTDIVSVEGGQHHALGLRFERRIARLGQQHLWTTRRRHDDE